MRVAIITGASSGIGRATAVFFARKKFRLALTGRNEEALRTVASECYQQGLKKNDVLITPLDLQEDSAPGVLVKATLDKFRKIDTLINSAGILTTGLVIDTDVKVYDEQMGINVRSLVNMTRIALPHIVKTKGTVVNVSSIAGPCPFPNVTYYCMSKAAVDQFTKCLALEMAPHGVRVNAVNPGVVETNVHKRAGMNDEQYAEFLEKCKKTHALGRHGTVEEVAEAVYWLASSKSSFTTGELLRVDGGRGIIFPR